VDFDDTPEEAEFRAHVRDWLSTNAPPFCADLPADHSGADYVACGRNWQKHKAQSGFASIGMPRVVGGRDASAMMEVIFGDEESRYGLPIGPFITIGTQLVAPTILAYGTPEQVNSTIHSTLFGDTLWCQLFSEPGAGSDLAGLRTKAERDGDGWIISGQKVWNSWAHVADWGILLARTDSEVAKHKGITYFLLDMRSAGIDVRRIRQISGESEFNEVFLTQVRIPDSCRLGAVGEGWKVAMTTLMNERITVGAESPHLPNVQSLIDLAAQRGSRSYRARIAQFAAQEQGMKYFRYRLLTQLSRGETPGAIAALGKLMYSKLLQDISATALDIGGLNALYPAENVTEFEKFQHGYFWGAAMRIAGGTDEILRNQLAERVLGLPGDFRVDKNIAFSAIASSG
jgi:alkylation response protein AidB-like acyl-CoA dehydrogenase